MIGEVARSDFALVLPKADPLEQEIEAALQPGYFIKYGAGWSFVEGPQTIARKRREGRGSRAHARNSARRGPKRRSPRPRAGEGFCLSGSRLVGGCA